MAKSKRKQKEVHLYFTQGNFEVLKKQANSDNKSLSEFIRSCVFEQTNKNMNDQLLTMTKLSSMDSKIDSLQLSFNALQNLFMYYIQLFFYTHKVPDNYINEQAFAQATGQTKQWFKDWSYFMYQQMPGFLEQINSALMETAAAAQGKGSDKEAGN